MLSLQSSKITFPRVNKHLILKCVRVRPRVKCSLSTGLDLRLARSHPTLAPGHSMSLNPESMAPEHGQCFAFLAPGGRKRFDVIFETKTKEWPGREDLNLRQALWVYRTRTTLGGSTSGPTFLIH